MAGRAGETFGRLKDAEAVIATIFRLLPFDSAPGPANIQLMKADIERMTLAYAKIESASPRATTWLKEVEQILRKRARNDSALLRRIRTANGHASLASYLVTQDTAFLSGFIAMVDTVNSSTWRVIDALHALARRVDVERLDPPLHLERDACEPALVDLDLAGGPDPPVEHLHADRLEADANRLQPLGAQGDLLPGRPRPRFVISVRIGRGRRW